MDNALAAPGLLGVAWIGRKLDPHPLATFVVVDTPLALQRLDDGDATTTSS